MAKVCTIADMKNDPTSLIEMVVAEKEPVYVKQGDKASVVMIDADTYLNKMQALAEFERIYRETPDVSLEDRKGAPKIAWRCTICGHVVEADELPDDYVCPICGVGKDKFERIEL